MGIITFKQSGVKPTPRTMQAPSRLPVVNTVTHLKYEEVHQDLFTLPQDYMLVHCVSADFALGAGIALRFRQQFKMNEMLERLQPFDAWDGTGYCLTVDMDRLFTQVTYEQGIYHVANLVTKEHYYDKPTMKTMQEALQDLRRQLYNLYPEVTKIGMPLIGCGLDKLNWNDVSQLIRMVFCDMDITITVCRID